MNEARLVVRATAAATAAWFSVASLGVARAEPSRDGGPMLSEAAIVERVFAKNPTLAAARTELRRAELLEEGEDRRHGFVLQFDGRAERTTNPSLGVSGVTIPETQTFAMGGELRRRLVWGTDVSLRLEGSSTRMEATFFNPATNPPQLMVLATGPGYGALAKLEIKQPLLRGAGRDIYEAGYVQARASRAEASSKSTQTASQLLRDTLIAYWELFYASREVDVRRRARAFYEERLTETADLVRTGSKAPVDALSFQTDLAKSEEDIATSLREERKHSNELTRLLGGENFGAPRVDATREPPMPSPPPPDAREHALATSYELTEKRARVELEEVKARTAADDLRSRLDVSAYVQARGLGNREVSPAFQQIRGLEAWSAHIDLTYEMALDGTRQHAERTRAELAIASARQTFEETKRRVVKDLEDAMANSEAAQRRLELAGATFSIAEQKLTSKVQGFRTGSSTAFEVRDAENDVRDAELRRMRAHVDWVQADLAIAHLSGRLLGRYRNSP